MKNIEVLKQEAMKKAHFNENGKAYIVYGGNTFSIKDKLKTAGARFSPILKWYFAEKTEIPDGYSLLEINFDDIYTYNSFTNQFLFKSDVDKIIRSRITALEDGPRLSFYPALENERLYDIPVEITKIRRFSGYYGSTTVYTFSATPYSFVWITTKVIGFPIGTKISLTGTIKKFEEYYGERITYLTRCIVKNIE